MPHGLDSRLVYPTDPDNLIMQSNNHQVKVSEMTPAPKRNRANRSHVTPDTKAILQRLETFLTDRDDQGRIHCAAKVGVYAFFDFDEEPVYVGQTREQLTTRIRRHLTNQRTDAVAMHVLDPLEVAEIEVWPLWHLENAASSVVKDELEAAEYALFQKVIADSPIGRVLNEKMPARSPTYNLPQSHRGSIIPEELRERLGHADLRIARRADTIANLASVIVERNVSIGLRNTLVTQAQRLERLARIRYQEVRGETPPEQVEAETIEHADGDASETIPE